MRVTQHRILIALAVAAVIAVIAYGGATYLVYDRLSAVAPHCGGRFASYTPAAAFAAPDEYERRLVAFFSEHLRG